MWAFTFKIIILISKTDQMVITFYQVLIFTTKSSIGDLKFQKPKPLLFIFFWFAYFQIIIC